MDNKWLVELKNHNFFLLAECNYLISYFYSNSSSLYFYNVFFLRKFRNFISLNNFFTLRHSSRSHQVTRRFHLVFNKLKNFTAAPVLENPLTRAVEVKHCPGRFGSLFYLENALFLFNFFFNKNNFYPHHGFDLYSVKSSKNGFIIFNLKKLHSRWNDGVTFMFNLFYYNLKPLVFGNIFFKKETLALNWHYGIFDIFLWKFYYSFFTDKKIQIDLLSNYFFLQMKKFNIRFCFVLDVNAHFKNFFFFKKNFFFSIGVINVFLSPWLVDYPFFIFSDNYTSQLFFVKLVFFLFKKSVFTRYNNFRRGFEFVKLI